MAAEPTATPRRTRLAGLTVGGLVAAAIGVLVRDALRDMCAKSARVT